ncbi:methanol dehydrogenase [cytochrome c] subunit [Ancylobacter sp. TS-1]|uniref:methanol dehydrogenase [cytochrome c] subunit n=1 Tax=Ancylobacter sp. TS-1 TaxID=1850374 RepID=UPI001265BEF9|nr:methanol dehydrogenase [cytochrome c] subunit [Ancylobacter sp. TS-1]QFR33757.1 methanol dehydrogenase [Ancylobacter sp. TS-1]
MSMIDRSVKFAFALAGAGALALAMAGGASAYDGTNCKAPGNCWEPKPGFPEKVAGSKYDPKHDPKEVNKQSESLKAMEARNAQRIANFKKTGKFVYDVSKIPSAN